MNLVEEKKALGLFKKYVPVGTDAHLMQQIAGALSAAGAAPIHFGALDDFLQDEAHGR